MKRTIKAIIFSICVICTVVFFHNCIYHENSFISFCEDLFEPYVASLYDDSVNPFNSNGHNAFIYTIPYCIFEVYIPKILNLHPLTCFEHISSYLYSFILFLLLFIIASNFTQFFKFNKLLCGLLLSIMVFPVFITIIDMSELYYIFSTRAWMCAYLIQTIFFLVFANELSAIFVKKEKFSKRRTIVFFLLLFCMANTYEMFRFISFMLLFILITLSALIYRDKKQLKTNLSYLFAYILFNIVLTCLSHYTYIHSNNFINFNAPLSYLTNYFAGFFKAYYKYILCNNSVTLVLLFVLTLIILFIKGGNKKNFFIYVSSLFTAIMTYPLFTMVIDFNPDGWKYTSYFHYACDHIGTRYVISLLLFSIILYCFGFLFSLLKNIKEKITALIVTVILLIPIYKTIIYKTYMKWHKVVISENYSKYYKDRKTNLYIMEKFFAMYGKDRGEFYTYSPHNIDYYDRMIAYLYYLYYSNRTLGEFHPDIKKYKVIHVCSDEDDLFTVCRDKMIKTVKEKTGYEFTQKELEEADFESIKELSYKY